VPYLTQPPSQFGSSLGSRVKWFCSVLSREMICAQPNTFGLLMCLLVILCGRVISVSSWAIVVVWKGIDAWVQIPVLTFFRVLQINYLCADKTIWRIFSRSILWNDLLLLSSSVSVRVFVCPNRELWPDRSRYEHPVWHKIFLPLSGHQPQKTPSENSIIFTPNFNCLRKKIHAAPLHITISFYGSVFTM
jgi:hypothetical protein